MVSYDDDDADFDNRFLFSSSPGSVVGVSFSAFHVNSIRVSAETGTFSSRLPIPGGLAAEVYSVRF